MRTLQPKNCKNYKYLRDTVISMILVEKYKEKRARNEIKKKEDHNG